MKEILNNLWNEYFSEECISVNTNEEKELIKKLADIREKTNAKLNEEQKNAVEKCIEAVYDVESAYRKKSFFKGCEFAVSFLFELGYNGKPFC